MTTSLLKPSPDLADPAASAGSMRRACVLAAVFVSFLAFSAIRSPVPAINEPHYLGKAKHFWNSDWCRGDFFLESSNAHSVFYVTVGWLTRFLSLEQTAWVGRTAVLLLLAIGWTRLVGRLVPGRWPPLWAAWAYLLLAAVADWSKAWRIGGSDAPVSLRIFDLSGEWIVGGVEAKVFAYGLLFWALALAAERRWYAAAIGAGLSVSFHPVVGIWGVAAAAFAGAVLWQSGRTEVLTADGADPFAGGPRWRVGVASVLLFAVSSLPGLVPAVQLMGGVPEREDFAADYIQVFYRLRHHLDPTQFPASAYASYGLLLVVWLVVRRRSARTAQEPAFALFVTGTLLIALGGLILGFAAPPLSEMWEYRLGMKLMKFYPFRLADVMVPIAAGIALAGWMQRRGQGAEARTKAHGWQAVGTSNHYSPLTTHHSPLTTWLGWVAFGGAMILSLLLPAYDANPRRMTERQLADWKDACRWIENHTPQDALFFTPPESWAFKWYAQRPEYVAFKDCPQDAEGIVEWNRRLKYLRGWGRHHGSGGYSLEELRLLHEQTGITHIVARRLGPFAIEPVYRNGSYRVYDLAAALAERRTDFQSVRQSSDGLENRPTVRAASPPP